MNQTSDWLGLVQQGSPSGQEGTLQAVRTRLQTVWLLQARLTARLTDSNYTLRDWFSRVPLVARRELYRLYEPDFRLVPLVARRELYRLYEPDFRLVPLVARRELYRLYEPDFRLFGYSRPDSLLD
ncbi:unnamed protein product [Coregonus sp. 'balchen']|nr:unnamed protein product [Coregonus sp. 'balchen']